MSITITPATLQQLPAIQSIGRETFCESFATVNTPEDMNKYLEDSFNDAQVTTELTNPLSQFYIAWHNEEAIGYLKLNLSTAQTDIKDETALEIERIYVKAAYHGKQVGQLLFNKAMETAHTQNKAYVWLGVWEHNPRAIAFYTKNGFAPFGTHIFLLGTDPQTDILMKKLL